MPLRSNAPTARLPRGECDFTCAKTDSNCSRTCADGPLRRHATELASAALLALLLQSGSAAAATEISDNLPIELDAEYSEFDRRADRVIFRNLKLTQGDLVIIADRAEASPADFDDSRWLFTGNVVMRNPESEVRSDSADIRVEDRRIRSVVLEGDPAEFEQQSLTDEGVPTAGHARRMAYDVDTGVLLMTGEAWLSDGSSEISGGRIAYDLVNEFVTADGDDTGQVRMRITPSTPPEPGNDP